MKIGDDNEVETSELVLEYVRAALDLMRALAWPVVVVVVIYVFRAQIAEKIQDLKSAKAPGVEASFDTEARAVEREATRAKIAADEEAAAEQKAAVSGNDSPGERRTAEAPTAEVPTVSTGTSEVVDVDGLSAAARDLRESADFSEAREISTTSPSAGVMLAYTNLERALRATEIIENFGRRPAVARTDAFATIRRLRINSDLMSVAEQLRQLRNEVVHGRKTDVSVSGAHDFINSCEILVGYLRDRTHAKLRHPSRPRAMLEAADLLQ